MRSSMTHTWMMAAFVATGCSLSGGSRQAKADLVTYSTESSWTTAVSGVQTVNIPDAYTADGAYDVDGVTFSQNSALGNGILFNLTYGGGIFSDQDPSVGVANILMTFSSPVTAFELSYDTQYGADVTFSLSNGDSTTQPSTGELYALPNYIGVTDSTPFTSVQITTADPVVSIGLVSYGNVLGSAVPEPSSLSLSGIGVVGMMVYVGRMRKAGRA